MRSRYTVAILGLLVGQLFVSSNVGAGTSASAHSASAHSFPTRSLSRALRRRNVDLLAHLPPRHWPNYSNYLVPASSHPLLARVPSWVRPLYRDAVEKQASYGPYVTAVTLNGMGSIEHLRELNVPILSAHQDHAIVVVNKVQLERLAWHSMFPQGTELVSQALALGAANARQMAVVAHTLTSASLLGRVSTGDVATCLSGHTDADGSCTLTAQERQWWCLTPGTSDSNGNGVSDDKEIQGIRDWLQHKTLSRLVQGPPFSGWSVLNKPGCTDADQDGVPDNVEIYVLGLNPNSPNTANDRYTDGQKLFGIGPPCPAGGCSDGLPYPQLPGWVKAPYDSPYVAAMPLPKVDVDENSIGVTPITTITSGTTTLAETEKSYSDSASQGDSYSVSNTKSWNNWSEVSQAITTPIGTAARAGRFKSRQQLETLLHGLEVRWLEDKDKPRIRARIMHAITLMARRLDWCDTFIVGGLTCHPLDVLKVAGGAALTVAGGGIAAAGAVACPETFGLGCAVAGGGGLIAFGGTSLIGSGWDGLFPPPNKAQPQQVYSPTIVNGVTDKQLSKITGQLTNGFQGVDNAIDGVTYAVDRTGDIIGQGLEDVAYAINAPRLTTTNTSGNAVGGALTSTHEVSQEHTITSTNAFFQGQQWSQAHAVDSSKAASLSFSYTVSNTGSDVLRELQNLSFNIYLGQDKTPIISYPAWQQFSNGSLQNLFPGDSHTFSTNSGQTTIYLTLDQMRRIDEGATIRVVLGNWSGSDQLYFQDALQSGVTIETDDGSTAGSPINWYVIPSWKKESLQDVLQRFFTPLGTDAGGVVNAVSIPDYTDPTSPTWVRQQLTTLSWWTMYFTQVDAAGNAQLNQVPAEPGNALVIRFDRDSDGDGYPDRMERQYGTNPFDPQSHPSPQLLAGQACTPDSNPVGIGSKMTCTLELQNTGTFPVFGVSADMYSPDGSTAITDDLVGGNGLVNPGQMVVVGSLMNVDTGNWGPNPSPVLAGSYTGGADQDYTFSAPANETVGGYQQCGSQNCPPAVLNWTCSTASQNSQPCADGASGSMDIGPNYQSPLPETVSDGAQIGLATGQIYGATSFTVHARAPGDTFQYKVNTLPYTPPSIIVHYSDMQGAHRIITPVILPSLGTPLYPTYDGQMVHDPGVHIVATRRVSDSSPNTTDIVVDSPPRPNDSNGGITPYSIQGSKLEVDIVSDGNVVSHSEYSLDLQPGPTEYPVTWSTSSFSKPYDPSADNIMSVFWTDSKGNIIDSTGRPLNTFAADPTPILNVGPTSWDLGTLVQGARVSQRIEVVNTGLLPLHISVNSPDSNVALADSSGKPLDALVTVSPAQSYAINATLDSSTEPAGPLSSSIVIRSDDPANPSATIPITATINQPSPGTQAMSFGVPNRPWDRLTRVYGNQSQYGQLTFLDGVPSDDSTAHPCIVSDLTGQLKGAGDSCGFVGTPSTGDMQFRVDVKCSYSVQLCSPQWSTAPIASTTTTSPTLDFIEDPACSPIRIHYFVDGNELPGSPTPWLPSGGDAGSVVAGPLRPGGHVFSIQAEGKIGGCNTGALSSWGGLFTISGYGPPLSGASALSVFTGYALQLPNYATFYPPVWNGDAGVVFKGEPNNNSYDSGAILLYNMSSSPVTVSDVSADVGSPPVHYDLPAWGVNTISPGNALILSQTKGENFDSSDATGICPSNGNYPTAQVHVTIGGVTTTYGDSLHILAPCDSNHEGHSWEYVGGPPVTVTTPLTQKLCMLDVVHRYCQYSASTRTGVPATSDIYLAGRIDSSSLPTPQDGGTVPPGFAVTPGETLTFGASGNASCFSQGTASTKPDGPCGRASTNISGWNGVSATVDNQSSFFLQGVFVGCSAHPCGPDEGRYPSTPAPAPINFSPATGACPAAYSGCNVGQDFASLSPAIGQTFFIGDGLANTGPGASGARQTFVVPKYADSLFLGYTDGCYATQGPPGCYQDNTGSFSVTVGSSIASKQDPSDTVLTVPDLVSNGQDYLIQYGQDLRFSETGTQTTHATVPAGQTFSAATLDAYVNNAGAGGSDMVSVDVGDTGQPQCTWSGTVSQPTEVFLSDTSSGAPCDLSAPVNAYLAANPTSGSTVDVPIAVSSTLASDVVLTNLSLTPGTGANLSVGPGDLTFGCPGAASCPAKVGDVVPVQVTVHNTGSQDAAAVDVGYFVGDPTKGASQSDCSASSFPLSQAWVMEGNSYIATVAAGGSAKASFNWNTAGFAGDQILCVLADPSNAIGENDRSNNTVSTSVTVTQYVLKVRASSGSMTYGHGVPAVTPAYSGFIGGDTAQSGLVGSPVCGTTATSGSAAGTYPSTCTEGTLQSVDGKYAFKFVPGTITVKLAQPRLSYTGPTLLHHRKAARLSGKLLSDQGEAVPGRVLRLTLSNRAKKQSCATGPTSASGLGACRVGRVKLAKGPATITVVFAGDPTGANYDYSSVRVVSKVRVV
jgi:MBG domain (YGX type)/CARDB/Bacterial TSP3 repeat